MMTAICPHTRDCGCRWDDMATTVVLRIRDDDHEAVGGYRTAGGIDGPARDDVWSYGQNVATVVTSVPYGRSFTAHVLAVPQGSQLPAMRIEQGDGPDGFLEG